ncbi:uncharacterized protein LOC119189406 [Manduca sexta]|uniref:uncharacterized protein LOC119189406 n=1 Tax=Manduca sexta TaxID=7130 RepID=UPI00188F29BC|nr:uncharacterized protein LOC119189406 [Manduca sexta]
MIIIILIFIPILHAISPYTYEFYNVIHGSLKFKDLYIQPDTNSTEDEEIDDESEEDIGFEQQLFPRIDIIATPHDHDLLDFNEISKQLSNITRRGSYGDFYGHDDPQDWLYGKMEPKKKMMLIKTNIQFLIHTRYKVYAALAQRKRFRTDKRYRLGYLFNRLRRLKTEMRKIIAAASLQNASNPWFKSLTSLMRLYEQVVRFDVDIRDTSDYIREIYNTESAVDFIIVGKKDSPNTASKNQ